MDSQHLAPCPGSAGQDGMHSCVISAHAPPGWESHITCYYSASRLLSASFNQSATQHRAGCKNPKNVMRLSWVPHPHSTTVHNLALGEKVLYLAKLPLRYVYLARDVTSQSMINWVTTANLDRLLDTASAYLGAGSRLWSYEPYKDFVAWFLCASHCTTCRGECFPPHSKVVFAF